MTKIIYFIAGTVATDEEKSAIAAIEAGKFDLLVRNGNANLKYGDTREACDFVAGDVPTLYDDVAVWSERATVADQQVLEGVSVKVGAAAAADYDVTFTVVDGVVTVMEMTLSA